MFETNRLKEITILFWPIAMTMMLTSILGFIDSAMMSHYDTYGVSAINFATQFQIIFGPMFFGITTGINIFTVQYFQRGDHKHLVNLFKIALLLMLPIALIYFICVMLFPEQIISFFIDPTSHTGIMAIEYFKIIALNIFMMPINLLFTYQFRAIKRPKITLVVSTLQSLCNIVLNYLLIFGNFGFPEMGIQGAAIATVISRYAFTLIYFVIGYYIKAPFTVGLLSKIEIERELLTTVLQKVWPLVLVEFGFGLARVIYTKLYSFVPIDQYNAMQISNLISFMINAFVIATASSAAIIVGSELAKDQDQDLENTMKNIWTFMFIASIVILVLSSLVLPLAIPLFNTNNQDILVHKLLIANAIYMAVRVFSSGIIAILKSGGDTKLILLIDAGMSYFVGIPITFITLLVFNDNILALKIALISEVIAKLITGLLRMRKNIWQQKL